MKTSTDFWYIFFLVCIEAGVMLKSGAAFTTQVLVLFTENAYILFNESHEEHPYLETKF